MGAEDLPKLDCRRTSAWPRRVHPMHSMNPVMTGLHRHAFTLIELLVVLAIIALLVSILVPALGRSRDAARNVQCLNNLRQIGLGIEMYMNTEGKNLLPEVRPLNSGSNTNDPSLLDIMEKYIDAPKPYEVTVGGDWIVTDPYRCPSDRGGGQGATDGRPVWQQTGTSYEYYPGLIMGAARLAQIRNFRNIQYAVTKAYEQPPRKPIVWDADDWHSPRFNSTDRSDSTAEFRWKRNAVWMGDFQASEVPFISNTERENLAREIGRLLGLPIR